MSLQSFLHLPGSLSNISGEDGHAEWLHYDTATAKRQSRTTVLTMGLRWSTAAGY